MLKNAAYINIKQKLISYIYCVVFLFFLIPCFLNAYAAELEGSKSNDIKESEKQDQDDDFTFDDIFAEPDDVKKDQKALAKEEDKKEDNKKTIKNKSEKSSNSSGLENNTITKQAIKNSNTKSEIKENKNTITNKDKSKNALTKKEADNQDGLLYEDEMLDPNIEQSSESQNDFDLNENLNDTKNAITKLNNLIKKSTQSTINKNAEPTKKQELSKNITKKQNQPSKNGKDAKKIFSEYEKQYVKRKINKEKSYKKNTQKTKELDLKKLSAKELEKIRKVRREAEKKKTALIKKYKDDIIKNKITLEETKKKDEMILQDTIKKAEEDKNLSLQNQEKEFTQKNDELWEKKEKIRKRLLLICTAQCAETRVLCEEKCDDKYSLSSRFGLELQGIADNLKEKARGAYLTKTAKESCSLGCRETARACSSNCEDYALDD